MAAKHKSQAKVLRLHRATGNAAIRYAARILGRSEDDFSEPDAHDEVRTLCPWHDDHHPSLSINVAKHGLWACPVCGIGGTLRDLYARIHELEDADRIQRKFNALFAEPKAKQPPLTLAQLAAAKALPVAFLERHGVEQSAKSVIFHYHMPDGTLAPRHRRRIALTGDRNRWTGKKRDGALVPYNLHILPSIKDRVLHICEGETDTLSLSFHGFSAIGIPGASMVGLLQNDYLTNITRIFACEDGDEAGGNFIKGLANRLKMLDWQGELRAVRMPHGLKDPNDLHRLNSSTFKDTFSAQLKHARLIELDFRPPEYSDVQLALEFAKRQADKMRFVESWKQWFVWDEKRWAEEHTLLVFDQSRKLCSEIAAKAELTIPKEEGGQALAHALASRRTVAAVENLARADRRLVATIEQWDANPWALNTPGGLVDLRTGVLRPATISDYCAKLTAVTPKQIPISLWLKFLQRIFNKDQELIAFMQRWCGYALTGITTEQKLVFGYGGGQNGKGTFVNAQRGVMGTYGKEAALDLFVATQGERHPTGIADLHGARLVTARETEQGHRWREALIKQITGGDPVKAHRMRQDDFEFIPQCKLFFTGNHRPVLRSIDKAIQRRFDLVPFTVEIPDAERDNLLGEKLKAEWPGILWWAIEGCREWQRIGLQPPKSVRKATEEYLSEQDSFQEFLDEHCELQTDYKMGTAEAYVEYSDFCKSRHEYALSQPLFAEELKRKGFEKAPRGKDDKRGFKGLRLKVGPALVAFEDWYKGCIIDADKASSNSEVFKHYMDQCRRAQVESLEFPRFYRALAAKGHKNDGTNVLGLEVPW